MLLIDAADGSPKRQRPQAVAFDRIFDDWTEKGGEFALGPVTGGEVVRTLPAPSCRMAIDFGYAVRQMIDKPEKELFGQRAAVIQTE
jgi:hypothetical protein